MGGGREEIVKQGRWLAHERAKRRYRGKPLSTPTLARLVNTYITALKLPVKSIHQQEISNLENATLDKGPKRLQPWITVLRDFIESGELDTMIAAAAEPSVIEGDGVVVAFSLPRKGGTTVRTPDGTVVGEIVWGQEKS